MTSAKELSLAAGVSYRVGRRETTQGRSRAAITKTFRGKPISGRRPFPPAIGTTLHGRPVSFAAHRGRTSFTVTSVGPPRSVYGSRRRNRFSLSEGTAQGCRIDCLRRRVDAADFPTVRKYGRACGIACDSHSADRRDRSGLCGDVVALHHRRERHYRAAGAVQPRTSRRQARPRLPLLPHLGGEIDVRFAAADAYLHDLPFAAVHAMPRCWRRCARAWPRTSRSTGKR